MDLRLESLGSIPADALIALSIATFAKFVHTHLPLSPNSIIWYCSGEVNRHTVRHTGPVSNGAAASVGLGP